MHGGDDAARGGSPRICKRYLKGGVDSASSPPKIRKCYFTTDVTTPSGTPPSMIERKHHHVGHDVDGVPRLDNASTTQDSPPPDADHSVAAAGEGPVSIGWQALPALGRPIDGAVAATASSPAGVGSDEGPKSPSALRTCFAGGPASQGSHTRPSFEPSRRSNSVGELVTIFSEPAVGPRRRIQAKTAEDTVCATAAAPLEEAQMPLLEPGRVYHAQAVSRGFRIPDGCTFRATRTGHVSVSLQREPGFVEGRVQVVPPSRVVPSTDEGKSMSRASRTQPSPIDELRQAKCIQLRYRQHLVRKRSPLSDGPIERVNAKAEKDQTLGVDLKPECLSEDKRTTSTPLKRAFAPIGSAGGPPSVSPMQLERPRPEAFRMSPGSGKRFDSRLHRRPRSRTVGDMSISQLARWSLINAGAVQPGAVPDSGEQGGDIIPDVSCVPDTSAALEDEGQDGGKPRIIRPTEKPPAWARRCEMQW